MSTREPVPRGQGNADASGGEAAQRDDVLERRREALRRLAHTQMLLDAVVDAGRREDQAALDAAELDVEPLARQSIARDQLPPGIDVEPLRAAVAAGDAVPDFRHRGLTRPLARLAARVVVGMMRFAAARQTTVNQGVLSAIDRLAESLRRVTDALEGMAVRLDRVDQRTRHNSAVLERRLQQGGRELTGRILEQAVSRDELAVRLSANDGALERLDELEKRTRALEQLIERLTAERAGEPRRRP